MHNHRGKVIIKIMVGKILTLINILLLNKAEGIIMEIQVSEAFLQVLMKKILLNPFLILFSVMTSIIRIEVKDKIKINMKIKIEIIIKLNLALKLNIIMVK